MSVADVDQFIARYLAAHRAAGRREDCALPVWVAAQAGRDDALAVRAELIARPDWEPLWSFESLSAVCSDPDASDVCQASQALHTRYLSGQDFERWRGQAENLVKRYGDKLTPEAWEHLIAWFATGHPNPKAFFAQSGVLAAIPASIDLCGLSCPHFPELADQPLAGERQDT